MTDKMSTCKRNALDLGLYSGVINQGACIGHKPTHRATHVRIELCQLLDTAGDKQRRSNAFFDSQNHTFRSLNADGRRSKLVYDHKREKEKLHIREREALNCTQPINIEEHSLHSRRKFGP